MESEVAAGVLLLFVIAMFVPYVLFLVSLSKFVNFMYLKNRTNEVGTAWVWTQLIPLWSYVAMPVMLGKLDNHYRTYLLENDIDLLSVRKPYSSTWGWVFYTTSIISFFIEFFLVFMMIALIVYWIHVVDARNSLENIVLTNQDHKKF